VTFETVTVGVITDRSYDVSNHADDYYLMCMK